MMKFKCSDPIAIVNDFECIPFCVLIISLVVFGIPTALAQETRPYDLGGASQPKPMKSLTKKEGQYKRVHQTALRLILQGKTEKVQKFLEQYLANHPGDAETLYMLGICHGQKSEIDIAEGYLQKAVDAGLPPGRLVAGPRSMLEPMRETELVKRLFNQFKTELIHGPMLGNLTDGSCSIWGRTSFESKVEILIFDQESNQEIARSLPVQSTAKNDFTFVAQVNGLMPDKAYSYAVVIDGQKSGFHGQFKTFHPRSQAAQFSFAFGGGAGYVPQNERMWNTIAESNPDAILLLGDNVYIDDPESVVMQQYTYHRRQSRPEWR
ncbi:MAG: PhoD-like phosphatase N-terminal domain-containing protein, partial [Planctomycetota bacterium]